MVPVYSIWYQHTYYGTSMLNMVPAHSLWHLYIYSMGYHHTCMAPVYSIGYQHTHYGTCILDGVQAYLLWHQYAQCVSAYSLRYQHTQWVPAYSYQSTLIPLGYHSNFQGVSLFFRALLYSIKYQRTPNDTSQFFMLYFHTVQGTRLSTANCL